MVASEAPPQPSPDDLWLRPLPASLPPAWELKEGHTRRRRRRSRRLPSARRHRGHSSPSSPSPDPSRSSGRLSLKRCRKGGPQDPCSVIRSASAPKQHRSRCFRRQLCVGGALGPCHLTAQHPSGHGLGACHLVQRPAGRKRPPRSRPRLRRWRSSCLRRRQTLRWEQRCKSYELHWQLSPTQ